MNSLQNRLKKIEDLLKPNEGEHLIICDARKGTEAIFMNSERVEIKNNVEETLKELLIEKNINPASSKVILIEISDFNK